MLESLLHGDFDNLEVNMTNHASHAVAMPSDVSYDNDAIYVPANNSMNSRKISRGQSTARAISATGYR